MRAATSMFSECGISCNHWVFYVSIAVWIASGLATLVWLNVVFRRYETTQALPIEYGAVQVWSPCRHARSITTLLPPWLLALCLLTKVQASLLPRSLRD